MESPSFLVTELPPRDNFEADLREFERAVSNLTRLYQFRDRDEAFRFDLTVSQAYLISILGRAAHSLSMGEISSKLSLDVSTTTRSVDGLVQRGLLKREPDTSDRRVVRVALAAKGKRIFARIEQQWLEIHRRVLEATPPSSRRAVVKAIQRIADEISRTRAKDDESP